MDAMIEGWGEFATLATAINLAGVAVSSALAAFFGALGAQRIISKGMIAEKISANLNLNNSAIQTCYTILNNAITFKKQHVVELKSRYEEAQNAAKMAKAGDVVRLLMDFRSLPLPRFPTNFAEQLFFQEMRLSGRAAAAAGTLLQSLDLLADSVRRREDLLNEVRTSDMTERERISLFLGIDLGQGRDARYQDLVHAISLYCDDVIFFSLILEHDLAQALPVKKSRWRRSVITSSSSRIKWRDGISQYMPNAAEYADWLAGYPDQSVPEILNTKRDNTNTMT